MTENEQYLAAKNGREYVVKDGDDFTVRIRARLNTFDRLEYAKSIAERKGWKL